MGWGVFKAAGDDGKASTADDAELGKKVNEVAKLTGKKSEDAKARGLLGDIDRLIDKGKSKGK